MATSISISNSLRGVLKPPPEEQVFSNPLLMDLILRNLSTQDNLRAALVSKSWCAQSRDFLKSKHRRIPMCVRVYYNSPCRKLAQFNEFLKETSRSSAQTAIKFNGIQYLHGDDKRGGLLKCPNCLITDSADGYGNSRREYVCKLYDQVMKTIKFNYIYLESTLTDSCPFAILIQVILQSRAEEIIELDVKNWMVAPRGFVRQYLYTPGRMRLYPNLKVLGLENEELHHETGFPFKTPSIKRITRFTYNPLNPIHCGWSNFPRHAVTTLGDQGGDLRQDQTSVRAAWKFVAEFQPKIERLCFEPVDFVGEEETFYSEEHQWDLFQLGQLVSPSLTFLKCSPSIFVFLKQSSNLEGNRNNIRHCFSKLEILNLTGRVGVNILDCLTAGGYYKDFPKLRSVEIYFDFGGPYQTIVFGPVNRVSECAFKTVTHLKLQSTSFTRNNFLPTMCALQLFSHTRLLTLSNHRVFKCDPTDHTYAEIINYIENLPFLEKLSLELDRTNSSLRELNLDHLFHGKDWDDQTGSTEETKSRVAFKSLISAHSTNVYDWFTDFKNITLVHHASCPPNKLFKRAHINPERFVVSRRTAELICRHRPGLTISLKVDNHGGNDCACHLQSNYFKYFEHLMTFASITLSSNSLYNNFSITFLNRNTNA